MKTTGTIRAKDVEHRNKNQGVVADTGILRGYSLSADCSAQDKNVLYKETNEIDHRKRKYGVVYHCWAWLGIYIVE